MGAKALAFTLTCLLLFSAAHANPLFDVFSGVTGFFVGLVAPPQTSAFWKCSGYCDPIVASSGMTTCNWVSNEVVEGPYDPTDTICCTSGVYIFVAPGGSGTTYKWQSCTPYSTAEICNGLDDDGDGVIDNINKTCSTNTGICSQGVQICTNGVWSECSGIMPQNEVCDGLDNDCDGVIDEGCVTEPVYTGYDHYCEEISISQQSDVTISGHFQSINDSYLRYFIVGLDCPYVDGKRVYLSSGCSYESCEGGRYCYMGVGSSGTYTYQFTGLSAGTHTICLWPTSINGYLWDITMDYAATPVQEECTTIGQDCTFEPTGGYYNSSCVCLPKKIDGNACVEDYECYNDTCISGACQTQESPANVCGDGVCEPPESNEYCAEGVCCTYGGSCWVYCPQDCAETYCGDGVCNEDQCIEDCGYLSLYVSTPNVTLGNKAYFSMVYSQLPILTVSDPDGSKVTSYSFNEVSDEAQLYSRAYKFTPIKTGTYTINAYIILSGLKTQEVNGSIVVFEPPVTDTCGDGVCGTTENETTCPGDCYVAPNKYCGDGICDADETGCWQDCGFVDVRTTKKSAYVDERVEFRINHTQGDMTISVFGPDFNEVSIYSLSSVAVCTAEFCLDKYYFRPAKTGTYKVSARLTVNNNTVADSDYVNVVETSVDLGWTLLASSDHVDSGHYLCGELTLEHQSIVKIKGVFRNTNDHYARFLLSCVDCDDIMNTWALTTNEGWGLYRTESRCDPQKSSGEFCIMGCCSEGTYMKSYNISAGTHNLCIWPTCPDKYSNVDRIWEADLYYSISHQYIVSGEENATDINVTEPFCGDGVHDPGETQANCCIDVGCPAHQYCSESNECVNENLPPGTNDTESYCGDGVHDPGETQDNCCIDVGCPAHQYCSESLNKCVKRAEDIEPTKLLTVALNIEVMKVKLDRLRNTVGLIYQYYQSQGDAEKEAKWNEIISEFDSVIDELTSIGQKLGEVPDESMLEETRRSMVIVKQSLRIIALKILEAY